MPQRTTTETEHAIAVSAPAETVYRLIAELENWPRLFPPTVHAERLELLGDTERIRIWATANGEVKNWISRRELDPAGLRIDFRQEVSAAPVAAMGGSWVLEPLAADRCRVRLLHDYRAVDDDPAGLKWIEEAVDRNSTSELAALRANAELLHAPGDRAFSFEDSVHVAGEAEDVFDFINEADLWVQRLPHVAAVSLAEPEKGVQRLGMETQASDGSTHTTTSIRVCFPHERIVYKQITLPALMNLHTGRWTFTPDPDGVVATSQHTVVINTENIQNVLGPEATVAQAARYVRNALSTNSRTTLEHAKGYAESQG
jgi:aromatase